jgi:hypothetical protein
MNPLQSGVERSRTAILQETLAKPLGVWPWPVAGRRAGLPPCATDVVGCMGVPAPAPGPRKALKSRANWKHGRFSVVNKEEDKRIRALLREISEILASYKGENL